VEAWTIVQSLWDSFGNFPCTILFENAFSGLSIILVCHFVSYHPERMSLKRFPVVWLLLQLSLITEACVPESHNPMRQQAILEEALKFTSPNPFSLTKRTNCGPAAGGAVCPSSQCCSSGVSDKVCIIRH
jgi:hypothetical protein